VGLPIIPSSVSQYLANAKVYFENHAQCPFCEMIDEEMLDSLRYIEFLAVSFFFCCSILSEEHNRVINRTENFIAFLPYASRIPYQVWILPLVHESNFFNIVPTQVRELSEVLLDAMTKVCFVNL
jgi:UDPglucose--hexose-1-phosphate uridylyltransferase